MTDAIKQTLRAAEIRKALESAKVSRTPGELTLLSLSGERFMARRDAKASNTNGGGK